MANLSIRRIDDEVIALLRVRAARNGVSMEEEARRLLRAAVMTEQPLGSLAVELFAGLDGELEIPERVIHEPISFD